MRRILVFFFLPLLLGAAAWVLFINPNKGDSPQNQGGFRSFLSLGNRGDDPTPPEEPAFPGVDAGAADVSLSATSPFSQIGVGPVAGYTAFSIEKKVTVPAADPKEKPATQTVIEHYVRYVSRTNGYVYEVKDGGIPTQITNTYIPNVYEAVFADNNKTVLVRFLRDDTRTIATHSIPIPDPNTDGTRTQLPGTYFPDTIASLALSLDGKNVAQIVPGVTETAVATSTAKNTGRREVYRGAFASWLPLWSSKDLYLQTKAAARAEGFLYRVDASNKRLVRVLGNIYGLTASVSPSGAYILYSSSTERGMSTTLLSTKTKEVQLLRQKILPEKCVWMKNEDLLCAGNEFVALAAYPDEWYRGTLSFDDKLYRIFPSLGAVDTIDEGDPGSYDAVTLRVNEAEGALYFIDKNTGLLWRFKY